MKTLYSRLAAAALVLVLLAGFWLTGNVRAEQPAVKVHNVNELISAIAPGAVIELAPGDYDLSSASTYGNRSGNPYVKWEDCYDGFQLVIHDLDGLTITGNGGMDTTRLISTSTMSNVLAIEDCTDVTLSGFTAGHEVQAEGCQAGVISLFRSENIQLRELGLFGCGAWGIEANRVKNILTVDCMIYECSSSGLNFYNCQNVTTAYCTVRNIGKTLDGYSQGYCLATFSNCDNAELSNCTLKDSTVYFLFSSYNSFGIRLKENTVCGNSAIGSIFDLADTDFVVETSNVFENNVFSHWHSQNWDSMRPEYALNEKGAVAFPEDPEPLRTTSEPVVAESVITAEQTRVEVATVDEFLAAIAPNTEIVLTGEFYDLSEAANYGQSGGEHYYWEEEFDGPSLNIYGLSNFSIVSADGDASMHTISARPRYANVLNFQFCSNVMLSGFTAGHTVEPGSCAGGVLNFSNSCDLLVDNCNLYGCGILGVSANDVQGLQVVNSCIYECSYGGISCTKTDGLVIGGCSFWDLGGDTFQLLSCYGATINGTTIQGDYFGD